MIDIVYIGDSKYASAIAVSASSALRHAANPSEIRIHVVTDDKDFPDIGYDVRYWKGSGREGWHGTELVWSRMDFAELFSDCDWVVSCDGDTLWMADPADLWNLRDNENVLMASPDVPSADGTPFEHFGWWHQNKLTMPLEKCYCCGLMLLNLKKMREENFAWKCQDFINQFSNPPMREQTVMCYAARDCSSPLPREWGVFSFWHTSIESPKLVHYVQDLPWKRDKLNRLMSDIVLLWWKECEALGLEKCFQGFRGCKNRLDYAWRRFVYIAMRPLAGVIERISWLKPHFRNARGLANV